MGVSVFSGLSVIKLFMTQPLFFLSFFFFTNGEKFSLCLTKLLKYLSHILPKFNEIGYYFLPCLLMLLFVHHKAMLIVRVLYYTQLAIHFPQKLFSAQKARNER